MEGTYVRRDIHTEETYTQRKHTCEWTIIRRNIYNTEGTYTDGNAHEGTYTPRSIHIEEHTHGRDICTSTDCVDM